MDNPVTDYFSDGNNHLPDPGTFLDIPLVRSWFDVLAWGTDTGLYIYQQSMSSKSGPRIQIGSRSYVVASSYDYLGLIGHPSIESIAVEAIHRYGTGTGGVRLLTGTCELHRELERELADFKGAEASLVFNSGYMANLGAISALVGPRDRAVVDARAHRSVIDACRVARVPLQTFRHNEPGSLEKVLKERPPNCRTLVVVDGVYSMDGDICPLPEIVDLKKRYRAFLMVDEAHSLGVLGQTGRGVSEHFGTSVEDVEIWMGALSKAIPSNGGFIAGRRDLIIYLQHAAAPFMFSAALAPAAAAAARESLMIIQQEPERLAALRRNSEYLLSQLSGLGYNTGKSESPIIPVILGTDENAYRMARALFDMGILASAVVWPAVRRGSARLRLCATAAMDQSCLDAILCGFGQLSESFTQSHQTATVSPG